MDIEPPLEQCGKVLKEKWATGIICIEIDFSFMVWVKVWRWNWKKKMKIHDVLIQVDFPPTCQWNRLKQKCKGNSPYAGQISIGEKKFSPTFIMEFHNRGHNKFTLNTMIKHNENKQFNSGG